METLKHVSLKKRLFLFHTDDVFEITKQVEYFSALLGLSPLDAAHNLSLLFSLYTLLTFSSSVYALIFYGLLLHVPCKEDICIRGMVKYVSNCFTMLSLCLIVILQIIQRKKTQQIRNGMKSVDERLKNIGIRVLYSSIFIIETLCTVVIIVAIPGIYIILIPSLPNLKAASSVLRETVDTVCVLLAYIMSKKCTIIINILEKHYDKINKKIKSLSSSIYYTGEETKATELLYIFNELAKLSENIEETNCLYITLLMGPIFINITGGIFSGCERIKILSTHKEEQISILSFIIFLTFFHATLWIIILLNIVGPCEKCKRKVSSVITVSTQIIEQKLLC